MFNSFVYIYIVYFRNIIMKIYWCYGVKLNWFWLEILSVFVFYFRFLYIDSVDL